MKLESSEHVMRKRSIDQPLRIHLVYDTSLHALPSDKQQLVKVCVIFERGFAPVISAHAYFVTLFHIWNVVAVDLKVPAR